MVSPKLHTSNVRIGPFLLFQGSDITKASRMGLSAGIVCQFTSITVPLPVPGDNLHDTSEHFYRTG